jgi:hypothetical protein
MAASCNQPLVCPLGQEMAGNMCVPSKKPIVAEKDKKKKEGDKDKDDEEKKKKKKKCPDNMRLGTLFGHQGKVCIGICPEPVCPEGTSLSGNRCQASGGASPGKDELNCYGVRGYCQCPDDWELAQGNAGTMCFAPACHIPPRCPEGLDMVNNQCVKAGTGGGQMAMAPPPPPRAPPPPPPKKKEEEDDVAAEKGPPPQNIDLSPLVSSLSLEDERWDRPFKEDNATLQNAQNLAGQSPQQLGAMSADTLARVLYVLEVEAPSAADAFRKKVQQAKPEPKLGAPLIFDEVKMYHRLYSVPCDGAVRREGSTWPPSYSCAGKAKTAPDDVSPVVTLGKPPTLLFKELDPNPPKAEVAREDAGLQSKRLAAFAERDKAALPEEALAAQPTDYCVGDRCYKSYNEVASALYPSAPPGTLPVFCAPVVEMLPDKTTRDSSTKVSCSANWLKTLRWRPWDKEWKPKNAPKPGTMPSYGCFASPHLMQEHMVVPDAPNSAGFYCHKRVFRVPVKLVEKSIEDRNQNIVRMCVKLRDQVWAEGFPSVNKEYRKWCKEQPNRPPDLCPDDSLDFNKPVDEIIPFMSMTREEMLYFFGHRELYCRADRQGLVHFLFNDKWAPSFICDVPRGVMESGPFEEGVQSCTIVPWAGEESKALLDSQEPGARPLSPEHLKARMHCWKFNRPTCEELSQDRTIDDVHKSNVFDVYDALKEVRRTHDARAWALKDLKDAEKLVSFQEKAGYADNGNDEGSFGVSDFCRFAGDMKHLQCGFTKESISAWFEVRKNEKPEGCDSGICRRGAYERGYLCGLFETPEFFSGKMHWICGIDTGLKGRALLEGARALCIGGKRGLHVHSPKGDRSTLQCYARRFRWVDNATTRVIARENSWPGLVLEAAEVAPRYEGFAVMNPNTLKDAQKEIIGAWRTDAIELVKWAEKTGHQLGHRTSLRLAMLKSTIPAVTAFKSVSFQIQDQDASSTIQKLLEEVRNGDRPADGRWYADFKQAIAPNMQFRVPCGPDASCFRGVQVVLRMTHLFNVLKTAQDAFLQQAKKYAREVRRQARLQRTKLQALLTRFEVLEAAVQSPVPNREKSNVFCVNDPTEDDDDKPEVQAKGGALGYVCNNSPLYIVGQVELMAPPPPHLKKKPTIAALKISMQKQKEIELIRLMNLEKMHDDKRNKVRFAWCYGGLEAAGPYGFEPPSVLTEPKPGSPYLMEAPTVAVTKDKSNRHWMKCGPFAFNDESWERVAPQAPAAVAKGGKGKGGGVFSMIMGLLGKVMGMASGKLGGSQMGQFAKMAMEFYEKWKAKYIEKAKSTWDSLKQKVEDAKKAAQDAKDAREEVKKRLIAAEGDERAQVKQEFADKDKELTRLTGELTSLLRQSRKEARMPKDTGSLISEITEEITTGVTGAVSALVKPKASELLNKLVEIVKKIILPVVKALHAAVGSVPFVGGALAMAVKAGYDNGISALADMALDQLFGVVERLFSKLVRPMVAPLVKAAQKMIAKLAQAQCAVDYPLLCGSDGKKEEESAYELQFGALPAKDRWLDRAFACRPPPIEPSLIREGVLAHHALIREGEVLRGQVASMARQITNEYLARFGYTYETWMAAVTHEPAAVMAERGKRIRTAIERTLAVGEAK